MKAAISGRADNAIVLSHKCGIAVRKAFYLRDMKCKLSALQESNSRPRRALSIFRGRGPILYIEQTTLAVDSKGIVHHRHARLLVGKPICYDETRSLDSSSESKNYSFSENENAIRCESTLTVL